MRSRNLDARRRADVVEASVVAAHVALLESERLALSAGRSVQEQQKWLERLESYSRWWRLVQMPLEKIGLRASQGHGVETALYAGRRRAGSPYPAVVLRRPFREGSLGSLWLVWDGTHRVRAAKGDNDVAIAAFVPVLQ